MKFKIQKTIRGKLLLWTGFCLLFLSAVLITYSSLTLRGKYLEDAERGVTVVSGELSKNVKERFDRSMLIARTLGQMLVTLKQSPPELQMTRDQLNEVLKGILKQNPHLIGTYTLWEPNAFDNNDAAHLGTPGNDSAGRFLPYWNRDANDNIKVEPLIDYEGQDTYYTLPKRVKNEVVLEPYIYNIQGKGVLLTSLVFPIIVNDTFIGISGVDISIDFLNKMIDVADIGIESAQVALVSNTGILAAVKGQPELVGKKLEEFHSKKWKEYQQTISKGEEKLYRHGDEIRVFVPIRFGESTAAWAVNINIPVSIVTSDAISSMWGNIMIGLIITILALGLLMLVAKKISDPVKQMLERTRNLNEGDADLTKRLSIHSGDELELLVNEFNTFIESIQRILISVKENIEEVRNSSDEFNSGSQDLASRTSQQAASITETSTTLEEFTSIVKNNTETSELASRKIQDFEVETKEKQDLFENVRRTMDAINASSKEIDNVMNVINDISFQTNLLALNAAVEAARAGEAGRGFAVVASEVRGLAQKTADSSKTIQEIVTRNVDSTRKGMELVKQTTAYFSSVTRVLHELSDVTQHIANASKEQFTGVEQIHQAIAQLETVINQNAALVEEFSSSSNNLNSNAKNLQQVADTFKTG